MLYPKDPSVQVSRSEGAIEFGWRKKAWEGWFYVALGLAFLVPMIVFVATYNAYGDQRVIQGNWAGLVFDAAVTLPIVYCGLAVALNTNRATATTETVSRTRGPVWFGKDVSFKAPGVKQFFAYSGYTGQSSSSYSFGAIYLIDADDHVHVLARGLPSTFAANQVCHELEDFYGIEDVPVYGVTTDPSHPGPRGQHS